MLYSTCYVVVTPLSKTLVVYPTIYFEFPTCVTKSDEIRQFNTPFAAAAFIRQYHDDKISVAV